MSYETDYQYRQKVDKAGGRMTQQHPMNLPQDGSAKGLLIFALIILAFIAFVVMVSVGGSPDGAAPAAGDGAIQTGPEVAPAIAPAQGE